MKMVQCPECQNNVPDSRLDEHREKMHMVVCEECVCVVAKTEMPTHKETCGKVSPPVSSQTICIAVGEDKWQLFVSDCKNGNLRAIQDSLANEAFESGEYNVSKNNNEALRNAVLKGNYEIVRELLGHRSFRIIEVELITQIVVLWDNISEKSYKNFNQMITMLFLCNYAKTRRYDLSASISKYSSNFPTTDITVIQDFISCEKKLSLLF